MNQTIYNIKDLPDPKNNPEFWQFLDDPIYKNNIIFLILNALRSININGISDNDCRAKLAQLKGLQEIFDLPEFYKIQTEKDEPLETDPFE